MRAEISLRGEDIYCRTDDGDDARPAFHQTQFQDWASRYEIAVRRDDSDALLLIGGEIYGYLNTAGWADRWAGATGPRELEILVPDARSDAARTLLDCPWELLRQPKRGYLAEDQLQPFMISRRIGGRAEIEQPQHGDFAAIMMAAVPRGEHELDFEAEEAAMLAATTRLRTSTMRFAVEESGTLQFLAQRLQFDGPFDALHLSCHGGIHPEKGPFLSLEDSQGSRALTNAGALVRGFGEARPKLIFLSACRTAEAGNETLSPFVQQMITAGIANALGWDGSVSDRDAIIFAENFYGQLCAGNRVPYAAALARFELLKIHRDDPIQGGHWHLARIWLGPQGGGRLMAPGKRRRKFRRDPGHKEFLDEKQQIPVATAVKFAGRRREAQQVIAALRQGEHAGVLIQGMGNLGKSSLAARVANRMPDLATIVVFGKYDGLSIFDQLLDALPPRETEKYRDFWRDSISADAGALKQALIELLEGAFFQQPILLIIDDLEQILQISKKAGSGDLVPVMDMPGEPDHYRITLTAVIEAFRVVETPSRLLLTSRYRFSLPSDTGDLADHLFIQPLTPMADRQRMKQWRAAEVAQKRDADDVEEFDEALLLRALTAASGNPGVQDVLTQPILNDEPEAAAKAITAIEVYLETGQPPDTPEAQELFNRMAFEAYGQALSGAERQTLRAATVFSAGLPVPFQALKAAANSLRVKAPGKALQRLTALGLIDDYGEIGWEGMKKHRHGAANPFARPLGGAVLQEAEQSKLANAVMQPLHQVWQDDDGDFPPDPRGLEAARLALIGGASTGMINRAVYAGGKYLQLHNRKETTFQALELVEAAIARIEAQGGAPGLQMLLMATNCAKILGERERQIELLEKGLTIPSDDEIGKAQVLGLHTEATAQEKDSKTVLDNFQRAADIFERLGDTRSRAITLGRIADLFARKGDIDEALRICIEEQLPVYEALGDKKSRTVTMGKIADIRMQKGEIEEALRIYKEEQLPVYEALGDIRSRAVTMGRIADILMLKGEIEEALRIRTEEELPVYEALGEKRERAVTMGKIADILMRRGEIEEALRICTEEELPIYEALGDIRSRSICLHRLAQILIDQDGLQDERRQEIQSYLEISFQDATSMGIPDGISHVGIDYAKSLAMDGDLPQAFSVLQQAKVGFEKLGHAKGIAFCDQLTGQFTEIMNKAREQQDNGHKDPPEDEA